MNKDEIHKNCGLLSLIPDPGKTMTGWPLNSETLYTKYGNAIIWPCITIITPSFNQMDFIEESIRSVLLQNYPNLEYFVIDGGSTDGSVEVIKKYEKWITWWVSEADRGQTHAINKGLERCTGELFNWINSDDYLEKDALFHIASAYLSNQKPDVVCGFTRIFNPEGETVLNSLMYVGQTKEDTLVNHWISQTSTFFSTRLLKELGLLNEKLNCVMDLEYWFRYLLNYREEELRILRINDNLAFFRLHAASKTSTIIEEMDDEVRCVENEILRKINAPKLLLKLRKCRKNYITFPRIELDRSVYITLIIKRDVMNIIKSRERKISFIKRLGWVWLFIRFVNEDWNYKVKVSLANVLFPGIYGKFKKKSVQY